MSRKIDFSGFKPVNQEKIFLLNNQDKNTEGTSRLESNNQSKNDTGILELIKQIFPGKILFSIKEVSELTNLSYEFIRRQVASGSIKAKAFGDRRMISITEVINIINNGVSNNGS